VGTALFGMGSVFYYGAVGSFFLAPYADKNTLFSLFILFFLSALALKVSAVPFHFWTPDAYDGAPTPLVGYIATAPKLALYMLLVKLALLFSQFKLWLVLVAVLSLLSMFYANFTAYAQRSVKRLLAYSSIAHAGYFLLGVSLSDQVLQKALLFYLGVYIFAVLGSFVVLSVFEKQEGFSHHLLEYGLGQRKPCSWRSAIHLFARLHWHPTYGSVCGKAGHVYGACKSWAWAFSLCLCGGKHNLRRVLPKAHKRYVLGGGRGKVQR